MGNRNQVSRGTQGEIDHFDSHWRIQNFRVSELFEHVRFGSTFKWLH